MSNGKRDFEVRATLLPTGDIAVSLMPIVLGIKHYQHKWSPQHQRMTTGVKFKYIHTSTTQKEAS